MSKKDYIPQSVSGFNDWQKQAIAKLTENKTTWGLPEDRLTAITAKATEWDTFYPRYADKNLRSSVVVEEKNVKMSDYGKDLRGFFAEYILNNSKISDADRVSLGLSSRDRVPTASVAPATQPVAKVDFSVRLQHKIAFSDSNTPTSKAKPAGVHGCQIWMKLGGEAPATAKELQYIATDTATPYLLEFDGADAGKTAYYWLRWVNKRGQSGPWSVPVSAMVVG